MVFSYLGVREHKRANEERNKRYSVEDQQRIATAAKISNRVRRLI